MKRCPTCHQRKPVEEFSWKDKARGRRCSTCRECMRVYIRNHYSNNVEYYVAKAKRRKKVYNEQTYKMILDYLLLHPCVDCSESDPVVLEFDHVEKGTKIAAISEMIRRQNAWDTIAKEIAKCEVRCANCHRRRTALQLGWHLFLTSA